MHGSSDSFQIGPRLANAGIGPAAVEPIT